MKKILFILLIAVAFSCEKKDKEEVITPVWYATRQNTTDIAAVANSAAYLIASYDASKDPNMGVSLGSLHKLKGNFELRIRFSSFATSGSGSLSDWLAITISDETTVRPLVGTILSNTDMYLEDQDGSVTEIKSTSGREGEFYVKRVGANYTTWFRAGEDTLFMNKENYSTKDISIAINVASLDNTAKYTSALIEDVIITGGGGELTTDNFDNNTITIYQ